MIALDSALQVHNLLHQMIIQKIRSLLSSGGIKNLCKGIQDMLDIKVKNEPMNLFTITQIFFLVKGTVCIQPKKDGGICTYFVV